MFLKSIDLFGFKSFAEKSRIEFSEGISALVGPNGCGKSNVVDAVKWVLGEQGTRSLRADRMEDIIFNGTETRKALNVAEVTLTLQNNGVLPLDVPEIGVKRRLFRSGESEYFINNAPVKLKDVRELFYDTGIGKTAYSIMEQGRIDQILSNRPEDRRALFEEAAGITRYKVRGREADRKLERTEANMHEVQNVLREVKRSYDTLERQADKTSRYRQVREELFAAEVLIQRHRLKRLREETVKQEAAVEKLRLRREKTRAKIDKLNESLEAEVDRVNSMESRLVEVQKRLYGVQLERSGRRERIDLIREQIEEVARKLARDTERRRAFTTKLETLSASRTEALDAVVAAEQRVRELDKTVEGIRERIDRAQERRSENAERVSEQEGRIGENDSRLTDLQEELRAATDELVDALERRLKESNYSSGTRKRNEAEIEAAVEALTIEVEGRRAVLDDRLRGSDTAESEETIRAGHERLAGIVERVRTAFTAYRAAIPGFLDELLAPEGAITKKRTLDEQIVVLHQDNRERRGDVQSLRDENARLQGTIEKERQNLEQMRMNRVQLEARAETERNTAERLEREILDIEQSIVDTDAQSKRDTERREALAAQIERLESEIENLRTDEAKLTAESKDLEGSIDANNRSLKDEEIHIKREMQELAETQEKFERAKVVLAEKNTEKRTLFESFEERHGRDLREFDSDRPLEGSASQARDTAATLRDELRAIGNVNLMAPEEFVQVKERYEFLAKQLDDLHVAREDLKKVTGEIQRESEQLFVETYNQIRKNFHSIFRRLFGGGRAELRLVDAENVLDSGINILVQPPGKKLESIALLSGGERSLTAVALLFATFMVRPSPFSLLDEIDAALDEHNVARFVEMLQEFAEQSQFVVITHNKKTVAGARTFLGVTMEESGVSKVVTVKVDGLVEQNV